DGGRQRDQRTGSNTTTGNVIYNYDGTCEWQMLGTRHKKHILSKLKIVIVTINIQKCTLTVLVNTIAV
ncbi:MAG: hypothetical protein ABF793_03120, partial [Lacticaseibacillus paracasei]